MKELNRHTPGQDYDHIAIGTGFDGLATNPKRPVPEPSAQRFI